MIAGFSVSKGTAFLLHVSPACSSRSLAFFPVMPRLRNLWPDHADDDRFWIHPIDHAPRAGAAEVSAG